MAANEGVDLGEVEVWQLAHKKKDAKDDEDPYYGNTSSDLSDYTDK